MSNQSSSSRSAGGDYKMRDAPPYQEPYQDPSTSKSTKKSSKSASKQPAQSSQSQPSASKKSSKSAGKQPGTVDDEPSNKASSKSAGKQPANVEDDTSVDETVYGNQAQYPAQQQSHTHPHANETYPDPNQQAYTTTPYQDPNQGFTYQAAQTTNYTFNAPTDIGGQSQHVTGKSKEPKEKKKSKEIHSHNYYGQTTVNHHNDTRD